VDLVTEGLVSMAEDLCKMTQIHQTKHEVGLAFHPVWKPVNSGHAQMHRSILSLPSKKERPVAESLFAAGRGCSLAAVFLQLHSPM
jgi:hypothetical protein